MLGRDERRPAVPAAQGGAGVGARAVPRQERVRQPRPAGRRGPAADAGRQRHHARLDPDRRPSTASSRDFYVRQLWDGKGSALVELMNPQAMTVYAELCGRTLARRTPAPATRSRSRATSARATASTGRWPSFAEAYADQNERDYNALCVRRSRPAASRPRQASDGARLTADPRRQLSCPRRGQRDAQQAQGQKAEFDAYVRQAAGNGGPGSEIAHAKQLLDSGAISQTEFEQIKQRALA